MSIKITVGEKIVSVSSPYDEGFVKQARQLGGKWVQGSYTWEFDARHEARVREICREIYGTDGEPVPTVTLHMRFSERDIDDAEIRIGGRAVVQKRNRDRMPDVMQGAALIEGRFKDYGGSAKYPRITLSSETALLEVLDVPRTIAEKLVEEDPEMYTIVQEETGDDALTPSEQSLVESLRSLPEDRLEMVLRQLVDRVENIGEK